jgi:hypothetical protein
LKSFQTATEAEGQDSKGGSRTTRKNKVTEKASSGEVEGRKLYLPEDLYFRLRTLAYQRGQKPSQGFRK